MNIGQIYLNQINDLEFDENQYSQNILPSNIAIISLHIYACPGSKFKINEKQDIIINGTGNYTLQCANFPIVDIRVYQGNLTETIPMIIDYVAAEE